MYEAMLCTMLQSTTNLVLSKAKSLLDHLMVDRSRSAFSMDACSRHLDATCHHIFSGNLRFGTDPVYVFCLNSSLQKGTKKTVKKLSFSGRIFLHCTAIVVDGAHMKL